MKCKLDKCPKYYYSDLRGSCEFVEYCNKDTECPLQEISNAHYNEYLSIERLIRLVGS